MEKYKIGDFVSEMHGRGLIGIITNIDSSSGLIEIKSWDEERWIEPSLCRPATEPEKEWMARKRFKPLKTVLSELSQKITSVLDHGEATSHSDDYKAGFRAAISVMDKFVSSIMFRLPE